MSVPEGVLDGRVIGTQVALGVSNARVGEGEWLLGMVLSSISACSDACSQVALAWVQPKLVSLACMHLLRLGWKCPAPSERRALEAQ